MHGKLVSERILANEQQQALEIESASICSHQTAHDAVQLGRTQSVAGLQRQHIKITHDSSPTIEPTAGTAILAASCMLADQLAHPSARPTPSARQ